MKTTIELDDELVRQAEAAAAASGQSLSELIGAALRLELGREADPTRRPVVLPSFKGDGLKPGVDLDRSAELREIMQRGDAAS
jgi:hypothetical protein